MKKAYNILLVALGVLVLSWFLPWLYGVVFPVGGSDPFVAWSPVSDRMIVSGNGGDKAIFAVDSTGRPTGETFTREQRDSLLPQIYFTQLMARDAMPDSVAGIEASMANLRHHRWVFSCLPRDVVKVTGADGTRYTAYDAADYRPLGRCFVENRPAVSQTVAGYIFPYGLSFTSIDDSLAKPRFEDRSWHALYLDVVLALLAFIIMRRRRLSTATAVCGAALTAVCGIFAFIPLLIIKN